MKNIIIHHGLPRKLYLGEKPDLSKVEIVAFCTDKPAQKGELLTLGWSKVNCKGCKSKEKMQYVVQ